MQQHEFDIPSCKKSGDLLMIHLSYMLYCGLEDQMVINYQVRMNKLEQTLSTTLKYILVVVQALFSTKSSAECRTK